VTAAGYAPDSVDFTADHRVLLSAFGDPAIWAVAVIGPLERIKKRKAADDAGRPQVVW
jgi:hypothetical protein